MGEGKLRLYNVKIQGFRRFDDEQNLNVATRMTAVVGPNEAGKTSLLKAIGYFTDHREIAPQDVSHSNRNEPVLRLSFFLDEADLSKAGLTEPSWLDVVKKQDGHLRYNIKPLPKRDLYYRIELARAIKKLKSSPVPLKVLQAHLTEDSPSLDEILTILNSPTAFSGEFYSDLRSLAESIQLANEEKIYRSFSKFSEVFEKLINFEEKHDPFQHAIDVLSKRVPPILNFTNEYRNIQLPYDLSLYMPAEPTAHQAPSKPLEELIRLSGLDIGALKSAIENSIGGIKAGLIADANSRLAELCHSTWRQSDAALQFSVDNYSLDVLVRNEKDFLLKDQYTDFSSRSDGYKQFIALQIFTFLKKTPKSILLIDEVEHHLHYDAQADLIQILQAESSIGNVIYTTHSAGSLPEDLGVGVRMVNWDQKDKRNSKIENKFWYKNDDQGFKPILFGMGAATLAFFPTRRALISEGATELLLLPSILRDSISKDTLNFQIVHGLSNINPTGLPMLDATGNRVCYLTDNDGGGKSLRDALTAAGVPQSHIFSVADIADDLITIEDILDSDIWSASVNQYISMYGKSRGVDAPIDSFPAVGRIGALPDGIKNEKISFAYNALEFLRAEPDRHLYSKEYANGLRSFVDRINSVLELKPLASAQMKS